MNHRISWILAGLVALALTAYAGTREMKVRGSGQADLSTGDFTAAGEATHLGVWTNSGNIVVTPVSPTLATVTGTAVFVAANGDELHADIVDGTLDFSAVPFKGNATFAWTGGTGRFANASGAVEFCLDQLPDGSFTLRGTGDIDY